MVCSTPAGRPSTPRRRLSEAHHDQVTRLMLQVTGLPDGDARRWRFVADTLEPAPPGIPSRLLVTWHASPDGPDLPALAPGRSGAWRWCCAARRDCATRACRMRKAGCSRWACGPPARCAASRSSWPTALGRARRSNARVTASRGHAPGVGRHRYAPVLIALAIGDQAGVAREDWRLFNRSGITHLVSISGMHVTSIAGVAGMLAAFLWRRALARHRIGRARAVASWAAWRPPGSRCCIACSRAGACRPGAPSSCWRRCWRRPCRLPLTGGRVLAVAAAW